LLLTPVPVLAHTLPEDGRRMSETPGTAETRGRTPPKQKARELARYLRGERPDYAYLKQVFRYLRDELEVEIPRVPKRLPHVPSEEELRRYYQRVAGIAERTTALAEMSSVSCTSA